jgi:cytochrome P450
MDTRTGPRPALPRTVAEPAMVRAILADPGHTVPGPGTGAPPVTMAWLRQNVARLSSGADHGRRRDLAVGLLRPLDLGLLRAGASRITSTIIAASDRRPFDAMALVARRVPGLVLARALGAADPDLAVAQLPAVAAAYLPGSPGSADADDGVARLTRLLPAGPGEHVAARIGLLIQAYAATAGLIGNAVAAGIREDHPVPAAQLVARVLRAEPPVRFTQRVAPSGETVALDLTVARDDPAGHLAFGYGEHACPGSAHAIALAEGTAEPLLARCRWTGAEISYPEPPALHAPECLELTGL